MASIMDMLVDVPFEDTEESAEKNVESNTTEEADTEQVQKNDKKADIFSLTDEEEENNDSTNISSFYTEPILIENAKAKADEKKTSGRVPRATKPIVGKVKESGNNTESDNDTDGENVTGKDLSQPEPEEPPYDPDNPDPNGPKYCHCRWGESGVMVECEECGEWYHDECIGLTEEETYNIETYYCAPCCSSNCDLVTKYKEDPVKLRQKIIDQIREEEKINKPKRKKSNIKEETKAISKKRPSKPRSTPSKTATPKTPRTPKAKAPKPKRVAQTERKEPRRNQVLNRSVPAKRSYSDDSSSDSDEDRVAFVICEECGDSFPNKRALVRHSRKHESQTDTKYECDECGKTFNTSKALRDHEVVHSGVKPFSCMFCGEAFFLMSQLTNHTNTKHLNVRHQCDHCSRSYSNKPSLLTHMKKVHGENEESD